MGGIKVEGGEDLVNSGMVWGDGERLLSKRDPNFY